MNSHNERLKRMIVIRKLGAWFVQISLLSNLKSECCVGFYVAYHPVIECTTENGVR